MHKTTGAAQLETKRCQRRRAPDSGPSTDACRMSTRRGGQIGLIYLQVRTEDRRRTVMHLKAIWMTLAVAASHTSTLHHSTSTDSVSNIVIKSARSSTLAFLPSQSGGVGPDCSAIGVPAMGWIFAPTRHLPLSACSLTYENVLHICQIRLLHFSALLSCSFFRTFSYSFIFSTLEGYKLFQRYFNKLRQQQAQQD